MEHLVSAIRKATGHILGLLCNAEKTKSALALESSADLLNLKIV